jgi:hypothetical protein
MPTVHIDRELKKPQTVYWTLPDEWCGPEKDYDTLGRPGQLPKGLGDIAGDAMDEIADLVGRDSVYVPYRDRESAWRRCHFHIYGVDKLPKDLKSENGHCWHYRRSVREAVLLKRSIAEREIEFQDFIVRHEIAHGWGLDHPDEDDWPHISSVMVPGSWMSENGRPYVRRFTEADMNALRLAQE